MISVKNICVIGDRFNNFLVNPNLISISELENMVANNCQCDNLNYTIYLGQGNNLNRIENLLKYIRIKKLENKYKFLFKEIPQKANKLLTHKHKMENILISEPMIVDNEGYSAYLLIDDRCSEMNDHITDQHIQGMVLIEAARQMTTAVTEKFYVEKSKQGKLSFVVKNMEVNFNNFIFPLEAKIICKINKIRGFGDSKNFDISVSFIQNDSVEMEFRCVFLLFSAGYLRPKQEKMALASIESYLRIKNALL